MVVISCTLPGCTYTTDDVSEAIAIALLTNHGLAHQNAHRGPKLDRPKVDIGITIEEWNISLRRWTWFKDGSHIDNASAPSQLFQCAGPDLGDRLLTSDANIATKTVNQILAAMRSLAVIPVAASVLRSELLQLRRERDESCRTFAARVRGKAEACVFLIRCQHQCQCGQIAYHQRLESVQRDNSPFIHSTSMLKTALSVCCVRLNSADSSTQPLLNRVLCTPATSAPVEHVFSQSELIMRPHRARMTDTLLETLMLLKCNGHIR